MARKNTFIIIIMLFSAIASHAQSAKPKADTLKIPAYTFTIAATEFQKMADTSYMVMQNYGIEMTGSQIRTSQDMVSRQWQRLFFNYAKPDTIRVVKGGKP